MDHLSFRPAVANPAGVARGQDLAATHITRMTTKRTTAPKSAAGIQQKAARRREEMERKLEIVRRFEVALPTVAPEYREEVQRWWDDKAKLSAAELDGFVYRVERRLQVPSRVLDAQELAKVRSGLFGPDEEPGYPVGFRKKGG